MSLRELPDFLKHGDPALTHPLGLEYGPNHPRGRPRLPWPQDPQSLDALARREWLALVEAGKIG
ncbi:MAG: hypothetical protein ABW203_05365 [Novosphingobium sp.]